MKEEEPSFSDLSKVETDLDDQAVEQPVDLLAINNFSDEVDDDNNVNEDNIKRNGDVHKDDEVVSLKKARKPEKPGYCNECDKHFTAQRSLKRHIAVVHELSQVLTCDICKKQYTSRDVYRRHLETHRPNGFGCQTCNKYFTTKDGLLKHQKLRHPLPSCTFHNTQFKSDDEMQQHLKDEHLNKYC